MDSVKQSVLFVCIHNSARSQMAEALLRQLAGDTSGALARSRCSTSFKAGRRFSYVISVCDGAAAERCPIFPGVTKRLSWSFEDP